MAHSTFAYEAQTHAGQPVTGTIDAAELPQAEQQLKTMGLRVLKLRPADVARPRRSLGAADFLAFNQQLAQLTAAGMPVERGLRLIASDLRRGRLKSTIESLASRLEAGQTLDQAFAEHRQQFPPLYGQIIDAGVRGGNLPAVLLALGRHLDTTRKLRTELVRTIAYPMMVLLAIGILLMFLGVAVFPLIIDAYVGIMHGGASVWRWKGFMSVERIGAPGLPLITSIAAYSSIFAGPILFGIAAIMIILPMLWGAWPGSGPGRVIDAFMSRLPLIGPVLRRSLIARWLDAVSVAVSAGMDLPNAIALASNAVASPPLARDSQQLIDALQAGKTIDAAAGLAVLPVSLPAILQAAMAAGNLPQAVALLADSYRQQAETRISLIPAVLTPILMTIVALIIGGLMLALLAPLAKLLSWIGNF